MTRNKLAPEVARTIEHERHAFHHKFGRYPSMLDPVFFDPDRDLPYPMRGRQLETYLSELSSRIGVEPAQLYAHHYVVREFDQRLHRRLWWDAIDDYKRLIAPPI